MTAPDCRRCGRPRAEHLAGPDGSLVCPKLATYDAGGGERPKPGTAVGDMRFDGRSERTR